MFRKLSLVVIVVVFKFSLCSAQYDACNALMIQQITASAFTNYYTQFDGSPFFNEKRYDASLKLSGGEIYYGLKVRIDIYKDELVYYNDMLNKHLIIDKHIIDEIYLENEKGEREFLIKNVYKKGDAGQNRYSFYFVHLSDSISLWSEQKKVLLKDNSTSAKRIRFFDFRCNYFMVINGNRTSIPLFKKAIAKKFPKNKQAILGYIDDYQLNLKDSRQLSFLFIKINELEKLEPSK